MSLYLYQESILKIMVTSTLADSVPLWALVLITAVIVLISSEIGWRLGNYRRIHDQEKNNTPTSAAVGAILALFAFLLAFTFNMAATRYDSRKQIVIQEANAVGTSYLRTNVLTEKPRAEARQLLIEYLTIRAGGASSVLSPEGRTKSAAIQEQLWAIAEAAEAQSNSYTTGLFIQSLNDLINLDTIRQAANRNRIPDSIWFMLGIVTFFSMAAIGYEFGLTGVHNWAITILLVFVFTTVIMLIADLDSPQEGLLKVSQQPLIDLLNRIGAQG